MNDNTSAPSVRDLLKALSPRDFLRIGVHEIAYVRPIVVRGVDKPVYAVYGADGTQLSVLDSLDMAIATMESNDLVPVTLH